MMRLRLESGRRVNHKGPGKAGAGPVDRGSEYEPDGKHKSFERFMNTEKSMMRRQCVRSASRVAQVVYK